MGSGSQPRRNNQVTKRQKSLVGTEAGSSPIGPERANNDLCVLAFDGSFISTDRGLVVGNQVFFVPSQQRDKLNILFENRQIGSYNGLNAAIMWECANNGYEYVGTVSVAAQVGSDLRAVARITTHHHE